MYRVEWLVANQVMLITAKGKVTAGELRSGMSLKHVMLTDRTLADNVHCVMDYRQVESMGQDAALRLRLRQREDEHGGWTIHVEDFPISRRLSDITMRLLTGRQMMTVTSVDDALRFLHHTDASIPVNMPPVGRAG